MPESYLCRLLVRGRKQDMPEIGQIVRWITRNKGLYLEVLECSSTRIAYQFEIASEPLRWLARISEKHPELVFLLDYERERRRQKGLAKVSKGQIKHYHV